jgi:hypothetical protein
MEKITVENDRQVLKNVEVLAKTAKSPATHLFAKEYILKIIVLLATV